MPERGCWGAEDLVEMQVVAVAHVAAEVELGAGGCRAVAVALRIVAGAGHQVTAARWLKRGSRQTALPNTSANISAASQTST